MKRAFIVISVFQGLLILHAHAVQTDSRVIISNVCSNDTVKGENAPRKVEMNINRGNLGIKYPKSPILIPEVTMDGHTLHFITPCTGLTLQLVQDDEVCYEAVITSDYLEIPSRFTGVYELQILRGSYVPCKDWTVKNRNKVPRCLSRLALREQTTL